MHPKLLFFRHKLFRYRSVEQEIARLPGMGRLLDIGCGDGENMLRFQDSSLHRVGLEISWPRLQTARRLDLDVLQVGGEQLPFADGAFDMIYIAHVLHHVAGYKQVLAEIKRCLASNGRVFMVETVTDHPLLRLGRTIHPIWQGDKVEVDWRYDDLTDILRAADFKIVQSERYNVIFFLWEMLPLAFWPFELFTPIFIYLDLLLAKLFNQYSAHCYFVLEMQKGGAVDN